MPITGNETVLDAINYADGLTPTAAPQNIRLVRPAPPGACCEQVLPVNLAAITSGGDPTTNYQFMPGDRIVVYRDPIVRFTVFIDRLAAPFQTVVGSMLQTAFTIRAVKFAALPVTTGRGCWHRGRSGADHEPAARARVPGSRADIHGGAAAATRETHASESLPAGSSLWKARNRPPLGMATGAVVRPGPLERHEIDES